MNSYLFPAAAVLLILAGLFVLHRLRRLRPAGTSGRAEAVGDFYDRHGEAFLQVYGDVIQAFRTNEVSRLLDYQAQAMGLKPGMRLLDAGSGVCGPAAWFATKYSVTVDAVNISEVQTLTAADRIERDGLTGKVNSIRGDYHRLPQLLPESSYDVVYFLESFGHSPDKGAAIRSAWQMLKPGGLLYIKDLFAREAALPGHSRAIRENIARIDKAYHYQVGDVYDVLRHLRRQGFILSSLKTVDIPLEDFENLSISNQFQDLTGINRIDQLQDYLFPVDFFEISCIKPWYDPGKGDNRYFFQNLYHLQVLKTPVNEL